MSPNLFQTNFCDGLQLRIGFMDGMQFKGEEITMAEKNIFKRGGILYIKAIWFLH